MVEYLTLLERTLAGGRPRQTRLGPTIARFGETFKYSMVSEFPLLTTRAMNIKPIAAELAAFLTGSTALKTFTDMGCNYWTPNAEAWRPGAGEVGKIYGYQWRYWNGVHDQIAALLHGLRDDPWNRRHVLTTWNPSDLPEMCLPPCHLLAQFQIDHEYLDMCVTMRSVDLCLGLPADMVLYGLLLELLARELELNAGTVTWFFGDAHIYEGHIPQLREQLKRTPYGRPQLLLAGPGIDAFRPDDAVLSHYEPHPAIKYQLYV